MSRRPTSVLLSLALAAGGVVALSGGAAAAPVGGPLIYGLTSTDALVAFRAGTGLPLTPTAITGLGGDDLVGIDTRPATGALYGIGKGNGSPDSIFTIDPATAVATKVADLVFTPTDVLPDVALTGDRFAVDFNPVPDRIRVISNTGQNLRINPATGAVLVDGDINGAGTPVVASAAYTNAVAGALTTTLYDIDVNSNQLLVQNPPNNGTLVTPVPLLATAPTANSAVGWDIDPVTGNGYASIDVGGTRSLYTTSTPGTTVAPALTATGIALPDVVDLAVATPRLGFTTATATVAESGGVATLTVSRAGDLGDTATVAYVTANGTATAGSDYTTTSGTLTFAPGEASKAITVPVATDTSFEPGETFTVTLSAPTAAVLNAASVITVTIANTAVPADGPLIYGLTATDQLVAFRAGTGLPLDPTAITGLGGDDLVGIDTRPATGALYAIGKGGTGNPDSIFTIDPATAVATKVADLVFTPTEVLPDTALTGDRFAVDVNPVPDRIRVISNTGQNLRINPLNGAVLVDGDINPSGFSVASAAYTNSVAGAATTTLYDIDVNNNQLLIQNPPNNGTLASPVPLLATAPTANSAAGWDIDPVTGSGFAVLDVAGTRSLYVTATPGAVVSPALSPTGIALPGVVDLAVATPRIGFAASAVAVAETGGAATLTVTRFGDSGGTATTAFTTVDGAATAGTDYTATSGTLTFGPGETSKTITVPVAVDLDVEGDEALTVVLSAPTASVLTATSTATVTITNKNATALTLDAPALVRAPGLATLSGRLTGPAGAGLGGRSVALTYLFADGSAPLQLAATAVTAEDGSFSTQVAPSRTGTWQAVFNGTAAETASGSPSRVTVVQLSAPRATGPTTLLAGSVGTYKGYVFPGSSNAKVKLQYLKGSTWVDLTGPVATTDGRFSISRVYGVKGTIKLRFLGLESASNAGSGSGVITLKVI